MPTLILADELRALCDLLTDVTRQLPEPNLHTVAR
jgi:hypothetical protein